MAVSIKTSLKSNKMYGSNVKSSKRVPFGATRLTRLSEVNHKLMCTVSRESLAGDEVTDRLCAWISC